MLEVVYLNFLELQLLKYVFAVIPIDSDFCKRRR